MKFKALLFVCCFSLFSSAFADNYQHLNTSSADKSKETNVKKAGYADACSIEIINYTDTDARVRGRFLDGSYLETFYINARDSRPHTISLFYHSECHSAMQNVSIDTWVSDWFYPHWDNIYHGYTPAGTTLTIGYLAKNQIKIAINKK